MLTRLYIDNFRCFEKFEWKPGRKQLILGRNGTGKSSLMDVVRLVKQFTENGETAERLFPWTQRTIWSDQMEQTLEIEASLENVTYLYRLVLGGGESRWSVQVRSESIYRDGAPIFEVNDGTVQIPSELVERPLVYPHDRNRSALASIGARPASEVFKRWLAGTLCFRLNPFSMMHQAEREDYWPEPDLSNFSAWYRHLLQSFPQENAALLDDLRRALDGFDHLWLKETGDAVRLLFAKFRRVSSTFDFRLVELSEGQRCLICLYVIMHFVVAKGRTVIIDEPDNFISLREIQPWLMGIEEMADDHKGQVILISHHPEILNQWAPAYGVQFVREGAGPVRVEKFRGDPESPLSAAELVARGWDLE